MGKGQSAHHTSEKRNRIRASTGKDKNRIKSQILLWPIRGSDGAPIIGPTNAAREAESQSRLAPPATDSGTLPNLKWTFTDCHNRLQPGGWARQTTGRELPIAQALNCVNMRLKAGAIRELHWHKPDEWGFV